IQIHSRNNSGGCGEVGYFLLPAYWGRGYATELADTLLDFGFTRLGLHKISARCNSNNLKSEGIMKKVGMTLEGELRKVRPKYGSWDDEKHYGILFDEWKRISC
ncbi:MAG TPA: GNAT family protein, partial [Ruminiclostridium sp.]|nr:GNAT family protein [Ruminiclostridium sp.]